jgi:DNA polymerase III subunit epsilon
MSREIVFDTETTGLKPFKGDRITEIGCVEVIDLLPTGNTFRRYVNPERDVPEEVVRITGLTTEFLSDKPLFAEIVEDFLNFIGDSKLVAHNARFDRDFVNVELTRLKREPFEEKRFIDTLLIARKKFPGAYNSLDALCKRFSVSLSGRSLHGALLDAKLLAEVYLELNGGRERKLDLSRNTPSPPRQGAQNASQARQQIKAITATLSAEQREEHRKFLQQIGDTPLWNKYL